MSHIKSSNVNAFLPHWMGKGDESAVPAHSVNPRKIPDHTYKAVPEYKWRDTIDLHQMRVSTAVHKVKEFLRDEEQRGDLDYVHIITGRGNKSPDGIPRIKIAVMRYLRERRYDFTEESEGGSLKIRIYKAFEHSKSLDGMKMRKERMRQRKQQGRSY